MEMARVRLKDDLDRMFDDLCSSAGSLTSPHKIANALRSVKGASISETTVRDYLPYLEDAFLFDAAKRFDLRGKRYFATLEKYYACDVGVRNARLNYRQLDENHLMENVVRDALMPAHDKDGILVIGLEDFLLDQDGLDLWASARAGAAFPLQDGPHASRRMRAVSPMKASISSGVPTVTRSQSLMRGAS